MLLQELHGVFSFRRRKSMKKKFRRLLSVITALAVAATMTGSIMSLSYADET